MSITGHLPSKSGDFDLEMMLMFGASGKERRDASFSGDDYYLFWQD